MKPLALALLACLVAQARADTLYFLGGPEPSGSLAYGGYRTVATGTGFAVTSVIYMGDDGSTAWTQPLDASFSFTTGPSLRGGSNSLVSFADGGSLTLMGSGDAGTPAAELFSGDLFSPDIQMVGGGYAFGAGGTGRYTQAMLDLFPSLSGGLVLADRTYQFSVFVAFDAATVAGGFASTGTYRQVAVGASSGQAPEPSSVALLGLGLAGAIGWGARRECNRAGLGLGSVGPEDEG
ncbi:hypothetical protein OJF2_28330 [Aquisphaera giovannonii]|uniref:Ice-binding protein C-terminal domain-containing protein n=1 Tax=Aquisphaera giovannonii TaxID=406548 RepID=A0A5B9W196_9BACT|nr:PEP-CTERM sorting domain-containing protein [Aquisphaera giovannonii]QEH34298.1 hypothetical protein OJF2_28330 [Aquisphaera giovannonii]